MQTNWHFKERKTVECQSNRRFFYGCKTHTVALITIIMRSTGLNAALFLNGLCALEGTTASGNNNNGHLTLHVLVYFYTANAIVIYCIATLIPLTVMHLFHSTKSNTV